jgi:signal transduction histidine kinase
VRGQLDELRASRARIVAAGDAERRRLERDLHDGAQQRLVAVGLALRMLAPSPQVDSAQAALQETIAELRAVAHGIFPAVLADEGLAAAIEALADDEPLRVGTLPRERMPPPVESAAYFVVAEAVRRAGAAQVSAARRDGLLVVDVTADHVPEPLADLEDRVGAADGTLEVDGRTLRVELPCA